MTDAALEQFDAQMASDMPQDIGGLVRGIVTREAHVLVCASRTYTFFGVKIDGLDISEQVVETVVALDSIPQVQVSVQGNCTVSINVMESFGFW